MRLRLTKSSILNVTYWKATFKFLALKAVLNGAKGNQIIDSDVKEWVNGLKDAVYNAKDMIIDDITTEALC